MCHDAIPSVILNHHQLPCSVLTVPVCGWTPLLQRQLGTHWPAWARLWLAGRCRERLPQRSWLALASLLWGWADGSGTAGWWLEGAGEPGGGSRQSAGLSDGPWRFAAWQAVGSAGEREAPGSWWAVTRALGFGLECCGGFGYEETVRWFSPRMPADSYLVNALDAGPEHNSLKGFLVPLFPLLREKSDSDHDFHWYNLLLIYHVFFGKLMT